MMPRVANSAPCSNPHKFINEIYLHHGEVLPYNLLGAIVACA